MNAAAWPEPAVASVTAGAPVGVDAFENKLAKVDAPFNVY